MDKTIRVTILGREYPLRVSETHEAFTRRIASLVDERIRAVEHQAPGHPDLTHAVVAAMSLAEELMTLQEAAPGLYGSEGAGELDLAEKGAETLRGFQTQASALADRLDAVLGDAAAGSPNPDAPPGVPTPPFGGAA